MEACMILKAICGSTQSRIAHIYFYQAMMTLHWMVVAVVQARQCMTPDLAWKF
jgi:hypothetical protein